MSEYVKFEDINLVYYYRSNLMCYNKFVELRSSPSLDRMLLADFVFDRNSNKLIKCRESLEYVLDIFTEINNGSIP
jgi:hypothetical protein